MKSAQFKSLSQAIFSMQSLLRGEIKPELHNKLSPILGYLKSAQQVLQNINNGQVYEIQAEKLGELADVISFNKYVSADVKTYCTKYIGKYKLNHNAKFWQRARDVVYSAMEKAKREEQLNTKLKKMQKQLADNRKAEAGLDKKVEGLQTQMKSNQPLSKQQEEALTKIFQSTIRGKVRLFKLSNNSQIYNYLKENSYQQIDYYLKQYNLSEEILRPILAESVKFQQLQQKMQKLIGINSAKQKEVSVADRCNRHWQKIEQLYLYYKKNELNKEKVQIIEEAIKSTCKGIPYEAKNNQRYENILAHEKIARIIAPVVQINQSQKKLYEILRAMVEIESGFVQNTNKSTVERCIKIANQLQKMINSKGYQLMRSVGNQITLPVNTLQQLFSRIDIWKQLQSKKQEFSPSTTTSNNKQQSSPSRHHPQTTTTTTITNYNKTMDNMWANKSTEQKAEREQIEQAKQDCLRESIKQQLQKAYELQQLNTRNLLLNEIENAGKLSWVQFTQKFDSKQKHAMVQNINNLTNKSFAEVIIKKVLVSTQKSVQLLSNTVCEALSMNRNQLVIIEQLTENSHKQDEENKRLTNQLNELKSKTSPNQIIISDQGSSSNSQQQQMKENNKEYCLKLENTISQLQATLEKLQINRNHFAQQYENQKSQGRALKEKYTELQTKLAEAQSILQTAAVKSKEQKLKWEQLEARYKQDIKQKQTEIENFSSINVQVSEYHKKTQQQNKTLHTQVSQLQQQVSQLNTKLTERYNESQAQQLEMNDYKAAYILLKDEVYSSIKKAEGVFLKKHEESIKTLQNETLLQITKKCDPNNQVLKPKCISPPKNKPQNQNRLRTEILEQKRDQHQFQASVIVSQIMNEIIRQVEINEGKYIEDLLTIGKQAYKKLREKDSKLIIIIQEKQKKIRELDEKIQKKTLQDISLQISSKATVVAEIEKMKQDLEQLNKDKKQLIEEMQRQRKELQDKLNQEKSAISKDLQKEKQDLMKVRKESNQTIQKQRQELTKIKSQASKSKQQVQKMKNVMSATITKRNQVDRQVMAKQKQLRQLIEKENKFKEQLKKAEEELEKKNKEKQLIDEMIAQMDQTKKQEQTLKQKVKQEMATLNMLEESQYQIQRKVADANRELSSLCQIRREYADIKSKLDKANSEYKQRQRAKTDEIVRKISNETKEAEKKLQKINEEYQYAQNALTRIENDLVKRRKQGEKITMLNPSQRGFPFPQMISPADTEFIISQVLKLNPHCTIKQAKLLFKYPLMGNIATQAYRYIGERPNFIVVVKLNSGRVIAMYSQISLEQKRLENHGISFIASVTNRKAFYFREDCEVEHSVAICAGSRLIFGNGELLLYMGYPSYMQVDINPHMYSFETVGQTAEVFVGGEVKSKHEVDEYEIIQVEFEEEKK